MSESQRLLNPRIAWITVLVGVCLFGGLALRASDGAETQIPHELSTQEAAWNRGDLEAFVETYADDCTFVGKRVLHGKGQLLARYRARYATGAAMGHLSFGDLEVKRVDDRVAIVTGTWHLERSAKAGGPVGGIFSLVWQRQSGRWRIILDHTTQQ